MPELPEVETVCRGLAPLMEGRVLRKVTARRADLRWPLPEHLGPRLSGRQVTHIGRRAKYGLIHLDGGDIVLFHLGMSGRMRVARAEDPPLSLEKHDHIVFETDRGDKILFNDPRRFGMVDLIKAEDFERHRLIKDLGPEPLSNRFSAAYLHSRLKGSRSPVKAALLDQRIVAGLGNIYVCEALYAAGISPVRRADRISAARTEKLAAAIVAVLHRAIAAGGSSLRDYARPSGELGYFQHSFKVYNREHNACATPACGAPVKRIVQSGRSSFYCPACQT